ncbi:hypothetical protein [Leucobacter aridicollis]|uniref:hypothetical protein n=1 Tax=Leucobacter aridicollis TaxID=283878 RepID=UPI0021020B13|nr:hypothetical protein [Leucobacter aridicollis]UTX52929.1 hypothetical protein KI794_14640 [Leucobacter aridicollis]
MQSFVVGHVSVDLLDGEHAIEMVPPSQWRGDKLARPATAVLANLKANDGLRAQVSLVHWDDLDEISLGFAEVLAGPVDYERLADAGAISPKLVEDKLIARLRALRYGANGRATGAAVEWSQIDVWAQGDSQARLHELGATRTGEYGVLFPSASRFKAEPALEVPTDAPAALFAAYALTRVMPIMTGHGKDAAESANA